MRSIDRRFYESPEWRSCKKTYLEKVNHLCERCLAQGRYEPAKIVHHKVYLTPETMTPELMFGFDNLEALCQACHNDEHGRSKNKKRWKFVEGELVTVDAPLG
jgi:5-methylcytosine-specific restriction endonuclease McrA